MPGEEEAPLRSNTQLHIATNCVGDSPGIREEEFQLLAGRHTHRVLSIFNIRGFHGMTVRPQLFRSHRQSCGLTQSRAVEHTAHQVTLPQNLRRQDTVRLFGFSPPSS